MVPKGSRTSGNDTTAINRLGKTASITTGKTRPTFLSVEDGIDLALAAPERPIVLSDGSDNPGGGAPGDSTFVLKALLEKGIESAGLACLWDPIVVRMAMAAGDGASLMVRLGGKMGPMSGDPLDPDVNAEWIDRIKRPRAEASS